VHMHRFMDGLVVDVDRDALRLAGGVDEVEIEREDEGLRGTLLLNLRHGDATSLPFAVKATFTSGWPTPNDACEHLREVDAAAWRELLLELLRRHASNAW